MVTRHHGAVKAAPRGPAAARRAKRADRDGDLAMDVTSKGAAGINKSNPPRGPRKTTNSRGAGLTSATAQRAILRAAAASDAAMRDIKTSISNRGLTELKVTGWQKSKASNNADGGVSSLIAWLEKKGSRKLGSRARNLKIKKSSVQGSDLIIKVPSEDATALVHLNGWEWAGTNIKVTRTDGSRPSDEAPSQAEQVKVMLRGVLDRRYNAETKLLDLSALGQDEDLKSQAIFDSKSTTSKFFPAMMRVLELAFESDVERHAAFLSVSLANNSLEDLAIVSTLSRTLPKIKNLDLSNNNFQKLDSLQIWRRRFKDLQHLVLTGNPIVQNQPSYAAEIVRWYPNLLMLNGIQVRTEEEAAAHAKVRNFPFPIRSPLFQDEGGIAENFVRTFFNGFDNDRAGLAALYYDAKSEFSFALNTHAPRDPNITEQTATHKQEWDLWIKKSRNLKIIKHLPARQSRLFRGQEAVRDAFVGMPATRHPDLATEAKKWMIEAQIQPGVPDINGGSPGGVDGFSITVHGELDEIDTASGAATRKRSFDRMFIVGPGGPTGVRIVSDMLTIRAYGGTQAFDPENFAAATNGVINRTASPSPQPDVPQLPAGMTIQTAEAMVLELQKQTNMTIYYSKDCLDQVGWDYNKALEAFGQARALLPPSAFMQPPTV